MPHSSSGCHQAGSGILALLVSGSLLLAACASVTRAPVARLDCADWNTKEFFKQATAEDVGRCLSQGADPNARAEFDITPLHTVARDSDSPAVVKALLDAGAEPNARKLGGQTPLHFVAGSDNPAVVKALLDAGADLEARDSLRQTPLDKAAMHSKTPAVVKALLDAGADPNPRTESGYSLLHGAVLFSETPEVVKILLDAGADPKAKDPAGRTPLEVVPSDSPPLRAALRAAFTDCGDWNTEEFFNLATAAVVARCLSEGADPNARDNDGKFPLHWTAQSESPAGVKALIDAGADLEARDNDGLTPLLRAAATPEYNWGTLDPEVQVALVEVLTDAGADLEARALLGGTPLHLAVAIGNPSAVKALLDAGANLEARADKGNTPLHWAAGFSTSPDWDRENPLASWGPYRAWLQWLAMKILLKAGADPNARAELGITPLHTAALQSENPAVVEALLAAGANPKAKADGGVTPVELIPDDSPLHGTDVYWRLNEARYR